jgi:hypothetical protein
MRKLENESKNNLDISINSNKIMSKESLKQKIDSSSNLQPVQNPFLVANKTVTNNNHSSNRSFL